MIRKLLFSVLFSLALINPCFAASAGIGGVFVDGKQLVSEITLGVGNLLINSAEVPNLSACGTSPSISGNGNVGTVTIGTGVTTSCTVTFDTAYTNAPGCTISGNNTAVTYIATTSTTVLTITSSADMDSDVLSYICLGY